MPGLLCSAFRNLNRGTGAILAGGLKFASIFIRLPATAELSRCKVDYLFHHDVIFSGEDFRQMNLYETEMGLGQTVSMAFKLVMDVERAVFVRQPRAVGGRFLDCRQDQGSLLSFPRRSGVYATVGGGGKGVVGGSVICETCEVVCSCPRLPAIDAFRMPGLQ